MRVWEVCLGGMFRMHVFNIKKGQVIEKRIR